MLAGRPGRPFQVPGRPENDVFACTGTLKRCFRVYGVTKTALGDPREPKKTLSVKTVCSRVQGHYYSIWRSLESPKKQFRYVRGHKNTAFAHARSQKRCFREYRLTKINYVYVCLCSAGLSVMCFLGAVWCSPGCSKLCVRCFMVFCTLFCRAFCRVFLMLYGVLQGIP